MTYPERRSNCPLNVALELFGDKWSLLLLRDMLVQGKSRYGEFLNSSEGISTNILASRLKQLEACGLLEKLADPLDRKTSVYLPTELGVSLLPVLLEVIRWGTAHMPDTGIPERVRAALQEGSADLMTECHSRVQEQRSRLILDPPQTNYTSV
ncbi:MAG: helix-turn-helix domain-containing protein [Halioglobus sp.]